MRPILEISSPLSKNPRMRKIFTSKSPLKVHACEDSRHDFMTMDLKFPVATIPSDGGNSCPLSVCLV